MEIWKDIEGYEGLYQVSTLGRVRSFHTYNYSGSTPRILKPRRQPAGYLFVQLSKDKVNTQYTIHRLVASTFIPNPEDLPQVNHKDEDKTNNCVENLEWCTAKYNSNYGTCIKRMSESKKGQCRSAEAIEKFRYSVMKKVMCVETGEIFDSVKSAKEIAHAPGISKVLKGVRETSGGYHWRYV